MAATSDWQAGAGIPKRLNGVPEILALAAIYYLAGKFGLSLASVNASATAVWPPTGMALAALLLRGYRLWPGVFLGAFLVNITTQGSLATALAIATGNALEALLAAGLARRFANGANAFARAQDVFKFSGLAAFLSTTSSATIGVTSLCLGGYAKWDQYGPIWMTWWLGDMVSNLIIAPTVLIWRTQGFSRITSKQGAEALLLLAIILLTGYLLFQGKTPASADHAPLGFLAIPPLLWAALRFGPQGASLSVLIMSGIALWGTLHGFGPFISRAHNDSLLFVQAFMGTSSLIALVLAALLAERKRAEAALRRAGDELAQANAALELKVQERTVKLREMISELEHFSYAIVHDVRAPLRAMQSFAMLAEQALATDRSPEVMEYLRRIRTSSERMDALVLGALDYNRAVLENLPLEPVDLSVLVRGIIESYPNLQPPKAQILVENQLPVVLGNKAGLTQILSNLLGNAVKFVAPGTLPRVRIRNEIRKETPGFHLAPSVHPSNASFARVWIEDNGIGIPREWHERIFDLFQRAEPGYEGTGAGLAIVRKVVQRMGGSVGVESEPGQGSRFWVELPLPH